MGRGLHLPSWISQKHTQQAAGTLSLSVGGELAVAEAAEEGSRALLPDKMATNVCCDHAECSQSEENVLYTPGIPQPCRSKRMLGCSGSLIILVLRECMLNWKHFENAGQNIKWYRINFTGL